MSHREFESFNSFESLTYPSCSRPFSAAPAWRSRSAKADSFGWCGWSTSDWSPAAGSCCRCRRCWSESRCCRIDHRPPGTLAPPDRTRIRRSSRTSPSLRCWWCSSTGRCRSCRRCPGWPREHPADWTSPRALGRGLGLLLRKWTGRVRVSVWLVSRFQIKTLNLRVSRERLADGRLPWAVQRSSCQSSHRMHWIRWMTDYDRQLETTNWPIRHSIDYLWRPRSHFSRSFVPVRWALVSRCERVPCSPAALADRARWSIGRCWTGWATFYWLRSDAEMRLNCDRNYAEMRLNWAWVEAEMSSKWTWNEAEMSFEMKCGVWKWKQLKKAKTETEIWFEWMTRKNTIEIRWKAVFELRAAEVGTTENSRTGNELGTAKLVTVELGRVRRIGFGAEAVRSLESSGPEQFSITVAETGRHRLGSKILAFKSKHTKCSLPILEKAKVNATALTVVLSGSFRRLSQTIHSNSSLESLKPFNRTVKCEMVNSRPAVSSDPLFCKTFRWIQLLSKDLSLRSKLH